MDNPCRNVGVCINQEPRIRYRCVCPAGFLSKNCDVAPERQTVSQRKHIFITIISGVRRLVVKSVRINTGDIRSLFGERSVYYSDIVKKIIKVIACALLLGVLAARVPVPDSCLAPLPSSLPSLSTHKICLNPSTPIVVQELISLFHRDYLPLTSIEIL
ncbi:beta-catenin binding [Homalodisca vitripennis]|nr:beta-catenin binding [Homalodisca vitripennis]